MHKRYTVKREKNLHDSESDLYGEMDGKTEVITIDDDLSEEQKGCTLIHECIHAIDDVLAIGLEEPQVVRLGTGIFMLLRDNPELFEGVTK